MACEVKHAAHMKASASFCVVHLSDPHTVPLVHFNVPELWLGGATAQ